MDNEKIISGKLMEETTISFTEVCEMCNVSEEWLVEIVEEGFIDVKLTNIKRAKFNINTIPRIRSAWRLHQELNINTPGVVLVLELLEELEQARSKLNILQRQIDVL